MAQIGQAAAWGISLLVVLIGCGCGSGGSTSSVVTPAIAPTTTRLAPATTAAGGPGLTLGVEGGGFDAGATVLWNGAARPTTFVSSTLLRAEISAADIASPGTAAVTVLARGRTTSALRFVFQPDRGAQWSISEFAFQSQASYANPFTDVTLTAEFTHSQGERLTLAAFYDGGATWRVRFLPTLPGTWTYRTNASNPADGGMHDVAGTLTVTAPAQGANALALHGGILKVAGNGRHITYSDGTPFFWLGDTWWFVPSSLMPFEGGTHNFQTLVSKRRAQNFSIFQTSFSERGPTRGLRTASARERRLDPLYWQQVDRYIAFANSNGLVAAMALAFHTDMEEAELEDWKFLWSYAVARYGASSVLWIVCGEYNLDRDAARVAKVLALGAHIRSIDPYRRAMSVHPWWYGGDDRQAWSQPWYDFAMIQAGHPGEPSVPPADVYRTAWDATPTRPFLEAEAGYEGIYGGTAFQIQPSQVRRLAYRAMQSGSLGFTYGAHGLWYPTQSATDDTFWAEVGNSLPWWEAMEFPGAEQMRILRSIYESVEWWRLAPRPGSVSEAGGNAIPESWQPTAASIGDETYLVYFPDGIDATISFRLQLTANADRSYNSFWTDPRTGAETAAAPTSCTGGVCNLPSRPGPGDWMLRLMTN